MPNKMLLVSKKWKWLLALTLLYHRYHYRYGFFFVIVVVIICCQFCHYHSNNHHKMIVIIIFIIIIIISSSSSRRRRITKNIINFILEIFSLSSSLSLSSFLITIIFRIFITIIYLHTWYTHTDKRPSIGLTMNPWCYIYVVQNISWDINSEIVSFW